jgi:hypothetical protein
MNQNQFNFKFNSTNFWVGALIFISLNVCVIVVAEYLIHKLFKKQNER